MFNLGDIIVYDNPFIKPEYRVYIRETLATKLLTHVIVTTIFREDD